MHGSVVLKLDLDIGRRWQWLGERWVVGHQGWRRQVVREREEGRAVWGGYEREGAEEGGEVRIWREGVVDPCFRRVCVKLFF